MNESKRASIESIRAAHVEQVEVEVPEWGGTVLLQGLTKKQSRLIRRNSTKRKDGELDLDSFEVALVLASIVEPVLTEEDVPALLDGPASAFERIVSEINKLNGLSEEAVQEAKARFPQESEPEDAVSTSGDA